MTESQAPQEHLPPEMLAALLQTVRRRQHQGDKVGARVVLRALAIQQHDDPRIWLALATVAASRDEQRQAIEQAISLDPQNALALRALERLNARDAGPTPSTAVAPKASAATTPALGIDTSTHHTSEIGAPAVGVATTPAFGTEQVAAITPAPALTPLPDAERARTIRWPLYVIIGVAAAVVLIVAAMLRAGAPSTGQAPTPTQALPGAVGAQPTEAAATAPLPTSAIGAAPIATAALSRTPAPSATARPSPTVPSPTPQVLVPGQIIVQGSWHASLLRPEYAVLLDGAVGALQPRGRFVLALVAIGNDSTIPARIPADLFTLRDVAGNQYASLAIASTIYLNAYGRGQRGDLSLEEEIPPGGGNVSVPLLFEVPSNARSFTLHMGDEPLGWPITGTATLPATPTP